VQVKAAVIASLVTVAGCKLVGGTQWSTGSGGASGASSGGSSGGSSGASESSAPSSGGASTSRFVSTKETAKKLNGMPGRPCTEENRYGIEGPCWDPPGREKALPMTHLQPGKREIEALDWRLYNPRAIYWFEMPREAKPGSDGEVLVPDTGGATSGYSPYAEEGFVRPALPTIVGAHVDKVVAAFDALDMPFSLLVKYSEHCEGTQGTVCKIQNTVDEESSHFELLVAMRVRHQGLPTEQRKRPAEDKMIDRPPAEVTAELKAIGFTNVVVVEKDLPCKRGIVCRVPGHEGWQKTTDSIELWVRHEKK
jgi:hypothetical protein